MFIVEKNVKEKVHSLGYRVDKSFLNILNVLVDRAIEGTVEWTKPKKTMTGRELAEWLGRKGIKI